MQKPLRRGDVEDLEPETVVTTDRARQGVTGHGVRYVLAFGLLGIIFAFAMTLVIFASLILFVGNLSAPHPFDGYPNCERRLPDE